MARVEDVEDGLHITSVGSLHSMARVEELGCGICILGVLFRLRRI